MTNWEKYASTPAKLAASLANTNGFIDVFNTWANGNGALLCATVPQRGARKAQRMSEIGRAHV